MVLTTCMPFMTVASAMNSEARKKPCGSDKLPVYPCDRESAFLKNDNIIQEW